MPKSDQGVSKDRYTVIPRSLIFLTKGDKVLLLKGAATKRLWANYYNGVGGHIEKGEDIFEAAQRELIEETGLVAEKLWLCGMVSVDTGESTGIIIFVFRGSSNQDTIIPSDEGGLEWVDQTKLDSYPLVEDLYQLLPRVLKINQQDSPFYAKSYYDQNEKLVLVFNQ